MKRVGLIFWWFLTVMASLVLLHPHALDRGAFVASDIEHPLVDNMVSWVIVLLLWAMWIAGAHNCALSCQEQVPDPFMKYVPAVLCYALFLCLMVEAVGVMINLLDSDTNKGPLSTLLNPFTRHGWARE